MFTIAFVEQENPLFGRLLNLLDFISSNKWEGQKIKTNNRLLSRMYRLLQIISEIKSVIVKKKNQKLLRLDAISKVLPHKTVQE
jgi:hypothetical protein